MYFGGQTMGEHHSDGTWTDYIYANGEKIASSTSADTRFHLAGTTLQTGYELGVNVSFPANYVVKAGDTISWRQYNQNAVGGLNVQFSNGTWTGWHLQAYDGQDTGQDSIEGKWQYRTASLNDYVGLTANAVTLVKDVYTSPGNWSMYIGDIAILSADGSVTHVFNGENESLSPQAIDPAYDSSFSAIVETVPTTSDPTVTNGWTINSTKYYLTDHLGTTRMEFAAGGWPVWQEHYTPFGEEINPQFTTNNYKFSGLERDSESNLDHATFRQYSSTAERWMSPDPYNGSMDPANPQSFNRYSYVGNMPLMFVESNRIGNKW